MIFQKPADQMQHVKVHVLKDDDTPVSIEMLEHIMSDFTKKNDKDQTVKITIIEDKNAEKHPASKNETSTENVTEAAESETKEPENDPESTTLIEKDNKDEGDSTTTQLPQDFTTTTQFAEVETETSNVDNIKDVIEKEMHQSFDGEQDTEPSNTVSPDQYEGEATEKTTKESNTETMIVQDDLIDTVKKMPEESPITEPPTSDVEMKTESAETEEVTQTTESLSESKITTTQEPFNNPDEIEVFEIVDPLDIKIDDETTKMLESVKQIVEKIEEQNRKKFESIKHLFSKNTELIDNGEDFIKLKDEILNANFDDTELGVLKK